MMNTDGPKRKRGGQSVFKPEFCEQARKLLALGLTDRDLALFFGVNRPTIWRWQGAFPEFRAAVEIGRRAPERLSALVRRAERARSLMVLGDERAVLRALEIARAPPGRGPGARPEKQVNRTALQHARLIFDFAPELVDQVLARELPFVKALEEAMQRRAAAQPKDSAAACR
jgi:hypothetical protein